jgi:hypothetical protein
MLAYGVSTLPSFPHSRRIKANLCSNSSHILCLIIYTTIQYVGHTYKLGSMFSLFLHKVLDSNSRLFKKKMDTILLFVGICGKFEVQYTNI